jgi:hypothetical protein
VELTQALVDASTETTNSDNVNGSGMRLSQILDSFTKVCRVLIRIMNNICRWSSCLKVPANIVAKGIQVADDGLEIVLGAAATYSERSFYPHARKKRENVQISGHRAQHQLRRGS